MLEEMVTGVQEGDIAARRTVLRQFVSNVEAGRERGRLWYTFPLSNLYLVPLGETYDILDPYGTGSIELYCQCADEIEGPPRGGYGWLIKALERKEEG